MPKRVAHPGRAGATGEHVEHPPTSEIPRPPAASQVVDQAGPALAHADEAVAALVLSQCYEHLRHTDGKRDQLVGGYVVLVGVLVGLWDKDHPSQVPPLLIVVAIMLGFLGLGVAATLTRYRRWHLRDIYASMVWQRLIIEKAPLTFRSVEAVWQRIGPRASAERRGLWQPGSVEQAVFILFSVFSFVPWYFVILSFEIAPLTIRRFATPVNHFIAIGLDLFVYGWTLLALHTWRLRRTTAPSRSAWMFAWLPDDAAAPPSERPAPPPAQGGNATAPGPRVAQRSGLP